jgi:hypothetical protein
MSLWRSNEVEGEEEGEQQHEGEGEEGFIELVPGRIIKPHIFPTNLPSWQEVWFELAVPLSAVSVWFVSSFMRSFWSIMAMVPRIHWSPPSTLLKGSLVFTETILIFIFIKTEQNQINIEIIWFSHQLTETTKAFC